jgi:hypothetical protein
VISPEQLRARARGARDQALREKLVLVEKVVVERQRTAEDQLQQRLVVAREQLEQRTRRAADLGCDQVILLRISAQLYDLRQAVLEELSRSASLDPDPYPQLRKLGPFTYGAVERWLDQDVQPPDARNTTPLPWLEALARWLDAQAGAGLMHRLLRSRPPLPPAVAQLYADCRKLKLKPVFEVFSKLDDSGIQLRIRWND